MRLNAAECLLENGSAAAISLECGERRVSYAELRAEVARAAGAWRAMGLRPDDRVMVFADDSIDWVVAYLGVIHAGGVAIGVNCRLPLADLAPLLVESEVSAIWCEDVHAGPLRGMAACLPQAPQVVVAHADGAGGWHGRVAAAAPIAAVARDAEDPALWIGTSGTTGTPKGVIHAQRCVRDAHSFAAALLGMNAGDRVYATSKLFFAYALGNSLFAGLRSGATVILDREWPTPERVAAMVAAHRPTLVFSVPTLYHKMLQAGIAAGLAAAGIRHFVSAGEALPAPLRAAWRAATGKAPISGYGTSETLCLMLYGDRDDGSLAPTPLTELELVAGADSPVPQRIRLRHPAVALGYWRRPEAQRDGFGGGWYAPGDVFLRRADGRLEYAGRNDDMLKIAGQWVSTLWVEQSLAQACGETLAQIGAVGVATGDGLAGLALFVVAAPGREAEARQRLELGIAALPGHRRPRWVHWPEALPLTATGKLQRGQLKRLHDEALARG